MQTPEKKIKKLWLDLEGVGRCNLGKASGSGTDGSAGVNRPKSGRTTIHSRVVEVAQRRFHIDLTEWPVQKLSPEMIDDQTIVIALLPELSLIPEYVFEKALDVLLAPIPDPAEHLDTLDFTATQIYYICWLVDYVIAETPLEIGSCRNEKDHVIPRPLAQLEPREIEPNYSLLNTLLPSLMISLAQTTWCDAIENRKNDGWELVEGQQVLSFNKIEEFNGYSRSFFNDEWGEPPVLRLLGRQF